MRKLVWKDLNAAILDVWRDHFPPGTEEGVLAPLFYPDHASWELLFVGINPSFSEQETAKRAAGVADISKFYRWNEFQEKHIPQMAEIQGRFLDSLQYFKPMQVIAQEVQLQWAHLDLYPLRQTNQKKALAYLKANERLRERLENLFKVTIHRLKPDIIVVANADASKCVKRLFDGSLTFDEGVGFHRLEMEGKNTAVFFSSMLSGQRALDTGSMERLRWHVRKAAVALKSARAANSIDRSGHLSWGAGDLEFE